jgi:hypothetical protein
MNYIQRLFDSAAPVTQGLSTPVAPPTAASSPVVAADQRLGVFPGLVDPFSPVPSLPGNNATPDRVAPGAEGPPAGRRSGTTEHAAPPPAEPVPAQQRRDRARQPLRSEGGSRISRPAHGLAPSPPPALLQDRPEPGPTSPSPLQRLVESAPLPDRHPAVPPEPKPRTAPPVPDPASPAEPATIMETAPQATPEQPAKAEVPVPTPRYRNPTEITPDQFKPRATEASPAPPTERPAHAPVYAAEPAETSRTEVPAQPEPLQPATDAGPSPFASQPHLPPAPDQHPARDATARPAPERIIERIREVPVSPPAPPKANTAAAQSVIGPLSQRRMGGWQPRQGGF